MMPPINMNDVVKMTQQVCDIKCDSAYETYIIGALASYVTLFSRGINALERIADALEARNVNADLLEACKAAKTAIEGLDNSDLYQKELSNLSAAIKKAEG
jgi:hypothetical protein